jgi:hypothetical protein
MAVVVQAPGQMLGKIDGIVGAHDFRQQHVAQAVLGLRGEVAKILPVLRPNRPTPLVFATP